MSRNPNDDDVYYTLARSITRKCDRQTCHAVSWNSFMLLMPLLSIFAPSLDEKGDFRKYSNTLTIIGKNLRNWDSDYKGQTETFGSLEISLEIVFLCTRE